MKVDSDKIRDVIGKGGATIRSITEESGASIDMTMMAPLPFLVRDLSRATRQSL